MLTAFVDYADWALDPASGGSYKREPSELVSGFLAVRLTIPDGARLRSMYHDTHKWIHVLEGGAVVDMEGVIIELRIGEALTVPRDTKHSVRYQAGTEVHIEWFEETPIRLRT